MKKLLYIILLALSASATITACTEEEVTPTELSKRSGGGGISDPK
jgi:hypothetical protein